MPIKRKSLISPLVPKEKIVKLAEKPREDNKPHFVVIDGKVFYESSKPL
jgi:hypothetical protein